jgi:hypothetical protein
MHVCMHTYIYTLYLQRAGVGQDAASMPETDIICASCVKPLCVCGLKAYVTIPSRPMEQVSGVSGLDRLKHGLAGICVCIYVHMVCVCRYVCMYIRIFFRTRSPQAGARWYVCMHLRIYTHTVCMYVHMYIYTNTHTHSLTHTQRCMHAYIHTY